ncbi:MAG: transglutaminase family protein [Cyanobacteria bacterium J06626_4]
MQPFSHSQWTAINALGQQVDRVLNEARVGLTMGGEPTYVSARDRTSLQWRYDALGEDKRHLGGQLLERLQANLGPTGSMRHQGLGKLYPGEAAPRWALGCFWRLDEVPLWQNAALLAKDGTTTPCDRSMAKTFMTELMTCLAIPRQAMIAAREPEDSDSATPAAWVLPLLTTLVAGQPVWQSCRWTGFNQGMTLLPGDLAAALRLPLDRLAETATWLTEACPLLESAPIRPEPVLPLAAADSIRLALVVEVRQGTVHVFLPPIAAARSYADVLTAIEATAEVLDQPVILEGYGPPDHQGIQGFKITPDPGVLEVNIHPAASWDELVHLHHSLDEAAIACGLSCEKYGLDGRLLGTGGGAHITIGGATPQQSPLLRRPDLLRSFLTYWQHHPSLSYIFAGQYIGPTSQSPRVDEARHDSLYELEMAFLALAPGKAVPPEVMDRLLSPLLQDVAGSTHRTALCIDKLYPIYNDRLQLGLLEFRGFEMPPHTGLRLLQMLLIRALVAQFWQHPYTQPLQRWGAELRDRWLLPHYLLQDLQAVLQELRVGGYEFKLSWFTPFLVRRFPQNGKLPLSQPPGGVLELRTALEPWPVIGDAGGSGTARPVDNSLERLQVFLTGVTPESLPEGALTERYAVLCNGYRLPLRATGHPGSYVSAVRFRARSPVGFAAAATVSHLAIAPQTPLHFQVINVAQNQGLGDLIYHTQMPEVAAEVTLPQSPEEARSRLQERFVPLSIGPVPRSMPPVVVHPEAPMTLDLRLVVQNQSE